jgi:hypothetical protein
MSPPPMSSMAPVRPTGITILAVLSAIGGILAILGSLALIGIGGVVGASGGGLLGGGAVVIGLFILVVGVLELAFAYGAWTLKPWAWTVGVAVEVLSLISSALGVVGGGNVSGQILPIVIAVAILYYLFTPPVKAAFGRR